MAFQLQTQNDISKFLFEIYEIYYEAKSNYLCSRFLYEHNYDKSKRQPYSNLQLIHLSISIHKLFIIQLDMLFSHTQEYSFSNFFNALNNTDATALGFTSTVVKPWRTKLKVQKKLTDDVHKLRNNLYAHKGKLADECKQMSTTFNDLERLFDIGEGLIVDAYKILGTEIQMDTWYDENQFIVHLQNLIQNPAIYNS